MKLKQIIKDIKSIGMSMTSGSLTLWICFATPMSYATDIEIYKVPESSVGKTTILLMLDTSGSMNGQMGNGNSDIRINVLKQGLRDVLNGTPVVPRVTDEIVMGLADFGNSNGRILAVARPLGDVVRKETLIDIKPRWQRYSKNVGNIWSSTKRTYYVTCTSYNTDQTCRRWSTETTTIPSGFSTSSPYESNTNQDCRLGNYNDCLYVYESSTRTRNITQRDLLLAKIDALMPNGGTPTPYAYAEAAAYLMGQSLDDNSSRLAYFVSSNSSYPGYYKECVSWSSNNTCTSWMPAGGYWNAGFLSSPTIVKGTAGSMGGLQGNYYQGRMAATGFDVSVSDSKNENNYIAPASITEQLNDEAQKTCSGQGIYFLTDGQPTPNGIAPDASGKSGTAYTLMSKALGNKGSLFSCAPSTLGNQSGGYTDNNHAWNCTGNFAEALLDPNRNPVGLSIRTAVVGFSSGFSSPTDNDVRDATTWGQIGGGGAYIGTNSASVSNSIMQFIDDIKQDIPSMSTGSSFIPNDALNPVQIQNSVYFPQFEPKVNPRDTQQIWYGNVKKFITVNNGIYGKDATDNNALVVVDGQIQDVKDLWSAGLTYDTKAPLFLKDGALSKIKWGKTNDDKTARKLLTDYKYDNGVVTKDFDLVQIKNTYTTDATTKADIAYSRALMGLLGYDLSSELITDTVLNGYNLLTVTPTVQQMGASLHSDPVLLTQSGKIIAQRNTTTKKVELTTESRDDYVLFGTSQGLVHVVRASDHANGIDGEEKFVFVPKEIIENQSETFKLSGGALTGGKTGLYYGMDGEWTAFTNYVSKDDGTLTVESSNRSVSGTNQAEELSGKQWVYGGMRMGGRSYYSLDLTDIDSPKLKFHIDPNSGKVYSADSPEGESFDDLLKMGQSWSKPTIGYVNWKGKRKLVMFVGGGYDAGGTNGDGLYANGIRTGYAGYESYNYVQSDSDNNVGAGVYMFDADSGELLWKAGAKNSKDEKVIYATNDALKYSVVSGIETVDRNNDGIIDHLYFGDLAGQGFRIDLKSTNGTDEFNSQVVQILDLHADDGTSPRFYNSPLFTSHRNSSEEGGADIVMAIFASGNKSGPLAGTVDSPNKKNTLGLNYDGVFAVYDYDAYNGNNGKYPYDVDVANPTIRTLGSASDTAQSALLKNLNDSSTGAEVGTATSGWGGWYYLFKDNASSALTNTGNIAAGLIKNLRPMIAMENNLYVPQFNPLDNGTSSSCGAGVKGNTFATRICLPLGKCLDQATYVYTLGPGDVALNVGPGTSNTEQKELVIPDPNKINVQCVGKGCAESGFIAAGGPVKFIPNKWYERYSRQGSGGR